jgi:hypothetical protein
MIYEGEILRCDGKSTDSLAFLTAGARFHSGDWESSPNINPEVGLRRLKKSWHIGCHILIQQGPSGSWPDESFTGWNGSDLMPAVPSSVNHEHGMLTTGCGCKQGTANYVYY